MDYKFDNGRVWLVVEDGRLFYLVEGFDNEGPTTEWREVKLPKGIEKDV